MVQVPQPALAGLGITLPDPPSDPATLLDVFAGCMLADKLKTEYYITVTDPRPSRESVAECAIYAHNLCHQYSSDAPANMEQDIEEIATRVLNRLLEPIRQEMRNGFRDVITEVRADIMGVRADIMSVRTDISRLHLSSVRAINSGRHDGSKRPYEILNFVNLEGREESPEDYDLPLLKNLSTIDNLVNAQLNSYVDRYHIAYGRLAADRTRENKLRKLKEHLGCIIASH